MCDYQRLTMVSFNAFNGEYTGIYVDSPVDGGFQFQSHNCS